MTQAIKFQLPTIGSFFYKISKLGMLIQKSFNNFHTYNKLWNQFKSVIKTGKYKYFLLLKWLLSKMIKLNVELFNKSIQKIRYEYKKKYQYKK